jgi:hypothetical protein
VCNSFNLCAIFWKSDLINGTGAHKCEIARNAAPEAQECRRIGTALLRRQLTAALCWNLLLWLGINICRIIAAVAALGAISRVAVVGTSNKDRARIGNKRGELPKSCMRLR